MHEVITLIALQRPREGQAILLAPSGALVFIMGYNIPAGRPICQNFRTLQILKCLKDPMCIYYISEKHGIQGYQIWHSRNLSLFFFRLWANSFPLSDSKLTQPLPQYTVHRTLNTIISRTFLAQFNLVCSGGFLLQPGVFLIKSFLLGPNLIVWEEAPQNRRLFGQKQWKVGQNNKTVNIKPKTLFVCLSKFS